MPSRALPFRSQELADRLLGYPAARRYLVGFSGGADSTALLHALHRQQKKLDVRIEACHFNHGLNSEADAWQAHCEAFCLERGIPLKCPGFNLSADQPNLENTARDLRYQWVSNHIDADTVYLTAHHADDRAETFLLNALRGSGIDGLSGIPEMRTLGPGRVIRPLLDYYRASLLEYLERHDLGWIEDPSNRDSRQDRNFLRNEVIPLIESRWPAARQSLVRTSAHLRSANEVLKKLLGQAGGPCSLDGFSLPVEVLTILGSEAPGLIMRDWLGRHDTPSVPQSRLSEFLCQLASADSRSKCELTWAGWSLRLYRSELHLSAPGEIPSCPGVEWSENDALDLGQELGTVRLRGEDPAPERGWSIGPRRPGVRIRLHSGGPARKLKKLLQEQHVPPWQRMAVPILYKDSEILAIGDWQLAPHFSEWLNRNELDYQWLPGRAELRETRDRCHAADDTQDPA